MAKLFLLLFLFPMLASAQKTYEWNKVKQVTFYELEQQDCRADSLEGKFRDVKGVTFKNGKFAKLLPTLRDYPRDVAHESKCYFLVVEFKDGTTIPFLYHHDQKAVFDFRKGHFNFLFFPPNTHKKLNEMVAAAIACIADPDCTQVK